MMQPLPYLCLSHCKLFSGLWCGVASAQDLVPHTVLSNRVGFRFPGPPLFLVLPASLLQDSPFRVFHLHLYAPVFLHWKSFSHCVVVKLKWKQLLVLNNTYYGCLPLYG